MRLWSSRFVRHTGVLFSSALVANLITLAGFLLLAQYFSTGTLGELYMFTALCSIVTMLALMGYHHAVPLMTAAELGAALAAGMPLAVIIVLALVPLSMFATYWYLVTPFVVASLVSQVGEMVLVRDQRPREIALLRVGVPVIAYSLSFVSFALYGDESRALLTAQTLAGGIGALTYWRVTISGYVTGGNFREGVRVLKAYARFPRYIGPGMIFHTIAYSLPVLVAGRFFSPATAAVYNMGFKLIFAPMQMLGAAVTQVYTGRLSERQQSQRDLFEGYSQLRSALFVTGAVSCVSIYALAPVLVKLLLREEWAPAATYARALTPLMFAMVAIAPLGSLFQFTNNQRYVYRVHALSALVSVGAFGAALLLDEFLYGVVMFSLLMMVRYVFILRKLNNLYGTTQCTS